MHIEITEQEYEELKKRAIKRAEDRIFYELTTKLDVLSDHELSAKSIKNSAASMLANKMLERVEKAIDDSDVINKALDSAERRMNKRVHDLLSSGLKISFADEKKDCRNE